MSTNQPSVKAINADLQALVKELKQAVAELEAHARPLEKLGIGNLSENQKTKLKEINKARIALAQKIARYDLMIVMNLNSAKKVQALASKVASANADLADSLQKINEVVRLVSTAAQILATADQLLRTIVAFGAIV